MGFRSSWLAVRSGKEEAALHALKLRPRGTACDELEPGWYALRVNGWFLVVGSGGDHMDRLEEVSARALSAGGEALFWRANDTEMAARLAHYVEGRLDWALAHDSGARLRTEGVVPPQIDAILVEQRAAQASENAGIEGNLRVDHLYEAAHLAGEALTGFRHDHFDAPPNCRFEVLRPSDELPPREIQERHGPFDVRFAVEVSLPTQVTLRPLKAVTVERFVVLDYANGELRNGFELAGGHLARDEERALELPSQEAVLTVLLSRFWGVQRLVVRVPKAVGNNSPRLN